MALADNALPFGLRDVKVRPIDSAGVVGASVDLPASRVFTFAETENFQELRGDDTVVGSHGDGPVVSWALEAGGLTLAAYKVIAGGAITNTGTAPNQKTTFKKLGTDARPYFQVEGQVISDSGGDVHALVYKCKVDGDISGEFSNGQFFLTGASGKGYPDASGNLYDFIHNETAAAVT